MKKIISIALLLAVAALCLCACGPQAGGAELPQPDPGSAEIPPADVLPTENKAFTNTDFVTLKNRNGVRFSSNSLGTYSIAYNSDTNLQTLAFIDYNTARQIYACSKPDCLHNSEACTAVLPENWWDISVAAAEDKLFFIYTIEGRAEISVADLSGGNRKVIFSAQSGMGKIGDIVSFNGEELVFCLYQMGDANNPNLPVPRLVAVHTETGELREIFSANDVVDISSLVDLYGGMLGVTDEGFWVKLWMQVPHEAADETLTDFYSSLSSYIYLVPYNGSAPQKTVELQGSDSLWGYPVGNSLYYCIDNANGSVSVHKCSSQSNTVLVQDLYSNITDKDSDMQTAKSITYWGSPDNQHLLLGMDEETFMNNHGDIVLRFAAAAIDCQTGECKRITLPECYYNATYMPVYCFASNGDEVLVVSDIRQVKEPGMVMPRLDKTFSIMKAADYINSVPNYRPVEIICDPT